MSPTTRSELATRPSQVCRFDGQFVLRSGQVVTSTAHQLHATELQ